MKTLQLAHNGKPIGTLGPTKIEALSLSWAKPEHLPNTLPYQIPWSVFRTLTEDPNKNKEALLANLRKELEIGPDVPLFLNIKPEWEKSTPKRNWHYCKNPAHFEMSGCQQCGDTHNVLWSEYEKHLWCTNCQIDFVPDFTGVLGTIIPLKTAQLIGFDFSRFNLLTKQVEVLDKNCNYTVKEELTKKANAILW